MSSYTRCRRNTYFVSIHMGTMMTLCLIDLLYVVGCFDISNFYAQLNNIYFWYSLGSFICKEEKPFLTHLFLWSISMTYLALLIIYLLTYIHALNL